MFFHRLAWRYLWSKKRDVFLVVIIRVAFWGIALGVMALIVVLSVMRGFHNELMDRVLQAESHLSVVTASEIPSDFIDEIQKNTKVRRVVPLWTAQAGLLKNGRLHGVILRAVPDELLPQEIMAQSLLSGRADIGINEAIVGCDLAQESGAQLGSDVELLLPVLHDTMMGELPEIIPIHVSGIAKTRYALADSMSILVRRSYIQRALPSGTSVSYEIFLTSPDFASEVKAWLMQKYGELAVRAYTWQEKHSSLWGAIRIERLVMIIILAFISLLAGFNAVTGLMIFVRDKKLDTAMLRLMGYTAYDITSLYMITGVTLSMGAVLLGVCAGGVFCYYIDAIRTFLATVFGLDLWSEDLYMIAQVPADCTWQLIASVSGLAFFVCIFAVWFPARRSVKHTPLNCFRYE